MLQVQQRRMQGSSAWSFAAGACSRSACPQSTPLKASRTEAALGHGMSSPPRIPRAVSSSYSAPHPLRLWSVHAVHRALVHLPRR